MRHAVHEALEEVASLTKGQEANAQQISRLRSQSAADYERFGQNTKLMQEQLQAVGQSLDAQHANLTKASLAYVTKHSHLTSKGSSTRSRLSLS